MTAHLRWFGGVIIITGLLTILGCGGSSAPRSEAPALDGIEFSGGGGDPHNYHNDYSRLPASTIAGKRQFKIAEARTDHGAAAELEADAPAANLPPDTPRKIVYTADLQLLVEDLTPVQESIEKLVKEHKGFVAQREISGSPPARTGRWKVRIPTTAFDAFVAAVAGLGEIQKNKVDSSDVTEEFYDLQTRIRNKKVEEEELLKLQKEATNRLQKEPTAKMADVLAVREKVEQARTEIERMQGKLNLLASLTEFTTVSIMVYERKAYVPPLAPTFTTTLGRTFGSSVDALVTFAQGIVIFVVALVPWLPVIAVIVIPLWLLIRRAARRSRPAPPPVVLPAQP